jgi:hypothetical protein
MLIVFLLYPLSVFLLFLLSVYLVAEDEYNLRCGATVPLKLYDSIMVKT